MDFLDPRFINITIHLIDSVRFADLVNDVLTETAARNNIDRSCVVTNLHITEPDGGIDARCTNCPRVVGEIIPRTFVDYQFKSGVHRKSISAIAKDDILAKPRVLEGLKNGHAFVYIAGWDRGDQTSENLIDELRSAGLALEEGQVIFLGVDTLGRLLRAFPGLIAKHIGMPDGLDSIEDWSRYPRLSNPFEADAAVNDRLDSLRSAIEMKGSTTRIIGAAGDGKTRLVLEALLTSSLESSVLYAHQAADVTPELINYLKHSADISCTLVVDEVEDDRAELLVDRFASRTSQDVRLVMIGLDTSTRVSTRVFEVPRLSTDVLYSIIKAIVPALPDDEARSIAADCEWSPKLAVLIAERVRENPSLVSRRGFVADRSLGTMLDKYLSPEAPEWKTMGALSLVMKLGWSGEVENESEDLFKALGLNAMDARRNIAMLHERYGVAPLVGRYRYVSPAALADHLAVREIELWTRPQLITVFGAMNSETKDSFCKRLRRLSAVMKNREVIEEVILGNQGSFLSLNDLETNAALLYQLAGPFPQATLRALKRIVLEASLEDLRAANNSRREVVWTLEQLLWREDTFIDASDLLLRLAIAENETWTNNASGLWIDTFQTVLGGTAAGLAPRLRVLRGAASSDNSIERQLAARALNKALTAEDMMTGRSFPLGDSPGMPREPWGPASYDEWADAYCASLSVLEPLINDANKEVRNEASNALRSALSATFQLPVKAFDEWVKVVKALGRSTPKVRLDLLTAVQSAIARCRYLVSDKSLGTGASRELNEEQKRRMSEVFEARAERLAELALDLTGDDFSIRFRATLTRRERTFHDDYYEARRLYREALADLGREILADPTLLSDEWEWLLDDNNFQYSGQFVDILGEFDEAHSLSESFARASEEHTKAIVWRSIYELSYGRHHDGSLVDRLLSEMVATTGSASQMFDLILRAGYSKTRVDYLEHLFESGTVNADAIANLAYSPWGPNLPPQEAVRVISAVVKNGAHVTVLLPFLRDYLSQIPTGVDAFRVVVTPILLSARGVELTDDQFEAWCELAKQNVNERPIEIASIAIEQATPKRRRIRATDEVRGLVADAWSAADPTDFFESVIAPWIDSDSSAGFWAREQIPGWLIATVPTEYLLDWVAHSPEARAHRLASLIGPPAREPSELHTELLQRFDSYGVGSAYYAKYMSGFYVGAQSDWVRGKLDGARAWLSASDSSVREWATNVISDLEDTLARYLSYEAEERLQ